MFAVVRTGGKQYRVAPGDKIVVEKLDGNAGDKVTLGDVLLAGGVGRRLLLRLRVLHGLRVLLGRRWSGKGKAAETGKQRGARHFDHLG